MKRRKLLVTGCGRSGTLYASEVWKSQGLDVRHENPIPPNGMMGRDGIASWYMAVADRCPPFGPSRAEYKFEFVIHQVRQPLEVIASVAQFILNDHLSREYIERNSPETKLSRREKLLLNRDQRFLQASRYWYYWNLMIQNNADVTVQAERLAALLPDLCSRLQIAYVPGVAERISTSTHGRYLYTNQPYWTIGWAELARLDRPLSRNIKDLARSYGY